MRGPATAGWADFKDVCQAVRDPRPAETYPVPPRLFLAHFAGLAGLFCIGILAAQLLPERPLQYYPGLAWELAENIAPAILGNLRLVMLLPVFCYAGIMLSLAVAALICLGFAPVIGYSISAASMLIFGLGLGAAVTHSPLIGPLYLFAIVGCLCHAVGRQQWLAWIGGAPALIYLTIIAVNGIGAGLLLQTDLFGWVLLPFIIALFGAIALFLGHIGASLTLALQQKYEAKDPQGYTTSTLIAQGTILLVLIIWAIRYTIARLSQPG